MFEVTVFSGMKPALASHLLERGQAEIAVNCLLESGELRPLGGLLKVDSIQGAAGTVYRYLDKWLSWPSRVILRDGPIAGDQKKRVYGTDSEGAFLFCNSDEFEKSGLKSRCSLGVPSPNSVPVVTVSGTGVEDKDIVSRVYVYTLVSDLGEEGPPSVPSAVVDVQEGQIVNVSGLSSVAEGFRTISLIRIYRTVAGTEKSEFHFVKELEDGTVSFADSAPDSDTAEVMVSRYWEPAPQKLQGLTSLPGCMFAGFKGNEVFLSEPGYPHAWPDSYGMSVPHEIVAMESTGNTLVILTRANVHTITVDDPSLSVPNRLDGYLPCTSAAGVVASPFGVIFPSLNGLYLVQSGNAPQNLTAGIFTEKDWRELKPDSFNAVWHAGQYICFHEPGAGFVFDPSSKLLTKLGFHCTALTVEPEGRLLHVAYPAGTQTVINRWDGSDFSLRSEWLSGEMRTSEPVNMEAAIVSADYANAPDDIFLKQPLELSCVGSDMAGSVCFGGDSNSFYRAQRKGEVRFRLIADGQQVFEGRVRTDSPFILPDGYLAKRFQMGIVSDIPISKVDIDPAMGDLL
ncbi:hypothetical protein [Maridesulfovibrio ferrireducens]|uniref:hypothetical protein n=1 Tax=Maridesulfovibrio ferrireducens TaxID=246191 RepID=UPI001A1E2C90|nr:hypothetical protein [Maridesulfovibrio ferrireducens]MBI9110315.1 hypothetical protein [Maridesulfovibrio ferrireducens]